MQRMNHEQCKVITQAQRAKQRALALAALTQVACLVESIAQEGKLDNHYFSECIDALMDEQYIAHRSFALGSSKIKRLFQGHSIPHAKHILTHTATLMTIEKKLAKQTNTLALISSGMERIHKQAAYFDNAHHGNVLAGLAHLYGETISTLNPRVIVRGKPEHLKQKHHTEQVRCLLFAGIRAAWVWRTSGGNAIRLLFGRKAILKQLKDSEATT